MTHATVDVMRPPYPTERGLDVYNTKLGMWVFLASEVMFFTALIRSYIILRFGAPGEWARPGIVLNIPVTAINTFLLICSSVTMVKAYATVADGEGHFFRLRPGARLSERLDFGLKFWMLATIVIGATFVSIQVYEYLHLVHRGLLPSGVREGSELAELVANLYFTKTLRGKYSQQDYRGIETIGLYWHFVDLVWIILFTIVYLI